MKPSFLDPNNPVTAAVMPLKEQAQGRAEAEARALVERYRAKLAEHGDDIRSAFPWPDSGRMGRSEYKQARARAQMAARLTVTKEGTHYFGSFRDPHYVQIDPASVEKFVKQSREEAAAQYDSFVIKLTGKVGKVKSAELRGSHVWGYSVLTITKDDGAVERWKTQQIVNTSVLGTLFNQWPTRKLKGGKA